MNRDKTVRFLAFLIIGSACAMERDIVITLPTSFPHKTMNASVITERTCAGNIMHAIKQRYENYRYDETIDLSYTSIDQGPNDALAKEVT